jgi:hypothetical protein
MKNNNRSNIGEPLSTFAHIQRCIYACALDQRATPTRQRCAPQTSPQGGSEFWNADQPAIVYQILIALSAFVLLVSPAAAHGVLPVQPEAFWQSWPFDPGVIVPLLFAHWLYDRGVLRLWAKAGKWRVIGWLRIAAFIGGEIVLIIAFVSPLDQLSGTHAGISLRNLS